VAKRCILPKKLSEEAYRKWPVGNQMVFGHVTDDIA